MKLLWIVALFASLLVAIPETWPAFAQSGTSPTSAAAKATAEAKPTWAGITVANADASSSWYQDNIGFKITRRMNLPEHRLRIAFLELNGFTLELIEFQDSVSIDTVKKKIPGLQDRDHLQSIVKLGFHIPNVDALAAALTARGIKLRMRPTDDREFHDRFFLVEDPDGNTLQFFQELHQ